MSPRNVNYLPLHAFRLQPRHPVISVVASPLINSTLLISRFTFPLSVATVWNASWRTVQPSSGRNLWRTARVKALETWCRGFRPYSRQGCRPSEYLIERGTGSRWREEVNKEKIFLHIFQISWVLSSIPMGTPPVAWRKNVLEHCFFKEGPYKYFSHPTTSSWGQFRGMLRRNSQFVRNLSASVPHVAKHLGMRRAGRGGVIEQSTVDSRGAAQWDAVVAGLNSFTAGVSKQHPLPRRGDVVNSCCISEVPSSILGLCHGEEVPAAGAEETWAMSAGRLAQRTPEHEAVVWQCL
jgi:hypothetical protein